MVSTEATIFHLGVSIDYIYILLYIIYYCWGLLKEEEKHWPLLIFSLYNTRFTVGWAIPLWVSLSNVTYVDHVTTSWEFDWIIAVSAFFGTRPLIYPHLILHQICWIQQGFFLAVMSRFPREQTHTHTITQIKHSTEQTLSRSCDSAHCQLSVQRQNTWELMVWNENVSKINANWVVPEVFVEANALRMMCSCLWKRLLFLFLQLWK